MRRREVKGIGGGVNQGNDKGCDNQSGDGEGRC